MSDDLFMYHSGQHALVYPNPKQIDIDKITGAIKVGGYFAFPTKFLRQFGWNVEDDDLARCLPRYGMPLIVPGTQMDPQTLARATKSMRSGR